MFCGTGFWARSCGGSGGGDRPAVASASFTVGLITNLRREVKGFFPPADVWTVRLNARRAVTLRRKSDPISPGRPFNVVAGEGPPPTTFVRTARKRRGWRAFARHDGVWATSTPWNRVATSGEVYQAGRVARQAIWGRGRSSGWHASKISTRRATEGHGDARTALRAKRSGVTAPWPSVALRVKILLACGPANEPAAARNEFPWRVVCGGRTEPAHPARCTSPSAL